MRIKRCKWRVQKRANWDECEGGCFLSCSMLIFLWSWLFIPATVGPTNCTKIGCCWKERSAVYCWNCELPRVCIFLCPTNFKNAKINKFILKKKRMRFGNHSIVTIFFYTAVAIDKSVVMHLWSFLRQRIRVGILGYTF